MLRDEQLICSILRNEPVAWPPSGEWSATDFLATCQENGVTSLVYHFLKKSGELANVSDDLLDSLRKHFLLVTAVELSRAAELGKVLDECSHSEIFPLLLKGAALSYTHYPSPGLRERCDTDLFIRIKDIDPFRRVMSNLGYAVGYPVYKSHQFNCIHPRVQFADSFDVHWRISNSARYARVLDFDEVFDRSVLLRMVGARALGNADALLLACIHLAGNPLHDASRLLWIYDVHLLATAMHPGELLDLAKLAVARQVQDVCLQALAKSRQCFATSIPAEVMELMSASPDTLSFGKKIAQSNLGLLWDDLLVLPGWRQKYALLRELFFPPKAYLENLYGKTGWMWQPWLYLRHIVGGVVKRVVLR
ncbi:MAG: nucleotidyltransferase domain-containing protein [Desulfobulbaceae bacterium]